MHADTSLTSSHTRPQLSSSLERVTALDLIGYMGSLIVGCQNYKRIMFKNLEYFPFQTNLEKCEKSIALSYIQYIINTIQLIKYIQQSFLSFSDIRSQLQVKFSTQCLSARSHIPYIITTVSQLPPAHRSDPSLFPQ